MECLVEVLAFLEFILLSSSWAITTGLAALGTATSGVKFADDGLNDILQRFLLGFQSFSIGLSVFIDPLGGKKRKKKLVTSQDNMLKSCQTHHLIDASTASLMLERSSSLSLPPSLSLSFI